MATRANDAIVPCGKLTREPQANRASLKGLLLGAPSHKCVAQEGRRAFAYRAVVVGRETRIGHVARGQGGMGRWRIGPLAPVHLQPASVHGAQLPSRFACRVAPSPSPAPAARGWPPPRPWRRSTLPRSCRPCARWPRPWPHLRDVGVPRRRSALRSRQWPGPSCLRIVPYRS